MCHLLETWQTVFSELKVSSASSISALCKHWWGIERVFISWWKFLKVLCNCHILYIIKIIHLKRLDNKSIINQDHILASTQHIKWCTLYMLFPIWYVRFIHFSYFIVAIWWYLMPPQSSPYSGDVGFKVIGNVWQLGATGYLLYISKCW